MKNKSLYKLLTVIVTAIIIITACTKESADVRLNPQLATTTVSGITDSSATVTGYVIARGGGFAEQGVCYSTTGMPTISNETVVTQDVSSPTYIAQLKGLDYTTRYFVRAYATANDGTTIYGDSLSFVTKIRLPIVTVDDISNIAGKTATGGGNVTDLGGGTVTVRGLCWNTAHLPTISNDTTVNGSGSGAFVSDLKGLMGAKTYYVRAYAINDAVVIAGKNAGISYSNEVSFTTLAATPEVTTNSATGEETTATASGSVTWDGGATITERGICYGTSANPTIDDSTVTSPGTTGTFQVNLTGLTSSTTYHYRAYATNSEGTAYGADMTFATYPTALYMIGDGVGGWDWNITNLPMVPVNSHPNLFWKIIWMNATGAFKFNSVQAWGGDFGKAGDINGDVWDKGGENVPVPGTAGYYMVVVDLSTNKIQVTTPQVYGIGDVFGGYNTGVPANLFTVDNDNEVIKFDNVPHDGELRIYAAASTLNCDWWQAEFIILGGNIEFRGTGGDQTRVDVTAGQSVSLDFITGTGTITP